MGHNDKGMLGLLGSPHLLDVCFWDPYPTYAAIQGQQIGLPLNTFRGVTNATTRIRVRVHDFLMLKIVLSGSSSRQLLVSSALGATLVSVMATWVVEFACLRTGPVHPSCAREARRGTSRHMFQISPIPPGAYWTVRDLISVTLRGPREIIYV